MIERYLKNNEYSNTIDIPIIRRLFPYISDTANVEIVAFLRTFFAEFPGSQKIDFADFLASLDDGGIGWHTKSAGKQLRLCPWGARTGISS